MSNEIIREIERIVKSYPRTFKHKLSQEQIKYIEDNADPKIRDYKFSMKVYWVIHDIHEFPKCQTDGKPITRPIASIPQGYYECPDQYRFCSIKCACKGKHWIETHSGPQSKERVQKRIATNQMKYGGKSPACSKRVIQKMKDTKLKLYGDSGFNNHQQAVLTNRERYGVDNVSQVKEVQLKKEATCLKHHGMRTVFCDGNKMKQIFTQMYGVDNPMKVESIKNQAKIAAEMNRGTEQWKTNHLNGHKKSRRKWILCWNDDGNNQTFKNGMVDEVELNKWQHRLQFDSKSEIKVFVFCKLEHGMDVEYQTSTKMHALQFCHNPS